MAWPATGGRTDFWSEGEKCTYRTRRDDHAWLSALALTASNSLWVRVPASRSSLALAISWEGDAVATERMYSVVAASACWALRAWRSAMLRPRAIRYTRTVRNGTKTRKMIHTALSQPLSSWSRKISEITANSAKRYAMNANDQKNSQMKFQNCSTGAILPFRGGPAGILKRQTNSPGRAPLGPKGPNPARKRHYAGPAERTVEQARDGGTGSGGPKRSAAH